MMSPRFGFVVLNYRNHRETVDCVDSIRVLPGDDYRIVVVDNCSPNDSFDVLRARYRDDPKITVLRSGRNGGYSYGNNVGIRALREQGIVDVIIATSDTRVEDANILERCAAAKHAGVAVVGPYIRDLDNRPQNPLLTDLSLRYIAALHLGAAWTILKKIVFGSPLGKLVDKSEVSANLGDAARPVDVYMVHGCFLYLSEHYLEHFPLLDEDLFMYGEEDIIAYNCIRQNLRVVYDPTIRVHHGDAKSTNTENDFRGKTLSDSLATLRTKIGFTRLVHAYLSARGR
jgi:GT2 family glycosyltransferase